MRLSNRIAALERQGAADLSPRAKAWLGWPLTDAELQAFDTEPVNIDDTANLSTEARVWLGID